MPYNDDNYIDIEPFFDSTHYYDSITGRDADDEAHCMMTDEMLEELEE